MLLYDCIVGDATLFQSAEMVEAGWEVVDPILDVWKALPPRNFPNYAAGSAGPKEAFDLIERDGRHWRTLEGSAPEKYAAWAQAGRSEVVLILCVPASRNGG